MSEKNEIAIISRSEIEKFTKIGLTNDQINILVKPTPKKYLKTRKGKGGQIWTYVSGGYINKVLNLVFGFDWDCNVLDHKFDLNIRSEERRVGKECRDK